MKKIINILYAGFISCAISATTSCGEDTYGDDPLDWVNTTNFFASTDDILIETRDRFMLSHG